MTVNVKQVLEKIYNNEIFDDELYFTGGTALAYYLNHRISEDIDIVSLSSLKHKIIIPNMNLLGATKLHDENIAALRMAGLFPDEYMMKFVLDNVKIEFFQANRSIQREILKNATFKKFENSKLKILDVKSVAKLKIIALIMRDKPRDLFDFGVILEHNILTQDEVVDLFLKVNSKMSSMNKIVTFLQSKKEPKDDEAVYSSETDRVDLSFEEIKLKVFEQMI
ncbi:nucleotidyl transferase AbiEii/AbiGii toxin family protein [Sulfurimonas sp. NWX79]|uniref:nucleotidyl transferase AbiEii/AbiGii toxin family protein n=1 Tax=Sulfurimonas sp. NWX79 TaxID=2925412 RepID=UPI003204D497